MGFLFLLLLIAALWWVISPMVRIYRTVRRAQRGFTVDLNDIFGTPGAQRGDEGETRHRYGWSGRRIRKKKIGKDVGEYVKFQEVPGAPEAPSRGKETTYVREQQITDVEWEDLP